LIISEVFYLLDNRRLLHVYSNELNILRATSAH